MTASRKTIAICVTLAAAILALGVAFAHAGRMHHGHGGGPFGEFGLGHGMGRALASLELTDDQKSRMKDILAEEGPRIEPLVDNLMTSKKALFEAIHSKAFDEKAVRSAASASAKASTELAVGRARIMSKFQALLTDEQRGRLDEIHERFEQRMEKRLGLARSIWKEHAADFIDAL